MSGFPSTFGQNFLKTGTFGKQGKQTIKNAGFAGVQDFLNQAGIDRNNLNAYTTNDLQSALNKKPAYTPPASSNMAGTQGGLASIGAPQQTNQQIQQPAQNFGVQAGNNFGQSFFKDGTFGAQGRDQIKQAGFTNVQDFLDTFGISRNNPNVTQQQLQQYLLQGKAPAQPAISQTSAEPVPQVTEAPTGPNLQDILATQATDLSNVGAAVLNEGNPVVNSMAQAASNYNVGSQQDLGKVDAMAAAARAQGANILNTLQRQQQAADQDIQNYFNAQPLDTLRANLALLNSQAQAGGRVNSRSNNEISSDLKRALLRDQANARLQSNNLFRQAITNEQGNQRTLDQNLANLFSGQGLNQGQLGLQGSGTAGQLANQTTQVGADIFNRGFENQLQTIALINNLAMQPFNIENQLRQQILNNFTGKQDIRSQEQLLRDQIEAQKSQSILGSLF